MPVLGGAADAAWQEPGPAAAALGAGRGGNETPGCLSQAEHSISVLAQRQGRGKGPFLGLLKRKRSLF